MRPPLINSDLGYVRVAVVSPEVRVADVAFNTKSICAALDRCSEAQVALALFPELGITGYTCGDLFYQRTLLDAALDALRIIAERASDLGICAVVGLPLMVDGRIYNCAAFVGGYGVLGIVPKTWLPNYNEFYEQRWFTSGYHLTMANAPIRDLTVHGEFVPFGSDLIFRAANMSDCVVGIEVCEDLWQLSHPAVGWHWQGRPCCSIHRQAPRCWAKPNTVANWCATKALAPLLPISTLVRAQANRQPISSTGGIR